MNFFNNFRLLNIILYKNKKYESLTIHFLNKEFLMEKV